MNDDTGNQPLTIQRRGLMLVLSSPSGAGKSTISRALLARHDDLTMSVSATTRPMRPGEVEGKDYHFIDQVKFDAMVAGGELLEHAPVFEIGRNFNHPPSMLSSTEEGLKVFFARTFTAHRIR